MKLVIATLLVVSLVLASFHHSALALAAPGFCGSKCGMRCSRSELKERCMKYCAICCQKCNCVPSGTYGNKHECPCYRDMVTSKGKPKCP